MLCCSAANGYDVDYLRVPVTDEKAPKTSDFAILAARAWDPPEGAALMYNCQMGRGRTTTGMIIASLIILRRRLSDSKGKRRQRLCTRASGKLLGVTEQPDHESRRLGVRAFKPKQSHAARVARLAIRDALLPQVRCPAGIATSLRCRLSICNRPRSRPS